MKRAKAELEQERILRKKLEAALATDRGPLAEVDTLVSSELIAGVRGAAHRAETLKKSIATPESKSVPGQLDQLLEELRGLERTISALTPTTLTDPEAKA